MNIKVCENGFTTDIIERNILQRKNRGPDFITDFPKRKVFVPTVQFNTKFFLFEINNSREKREEQQVRERDRAKCFESARERQAAPVKFQESFLKMKAVSESRMVDCCRFFFRKKLIILTKQIFLSIM